MPFIRRAQNQVLVLTVVVVAACSPAGQVPSSAPASPSSPAAATTPPTAAPTAAASPSSDTAINVKDGEPWIVYQHWTQDEGNTLRLIRPDGTGDHALLEVSNIGQFHPDWSPDGKRIAYATDNDIWIVHADGSDATKVFDCMAPCVYGSEPAWSPDGETIAFITGTPDGDVARQTASAVDLATGAVRTLYESDGADYPAYVRWSPDATSVVLDIVRYPDDKVDSNPVIGEAIAVLDLGAAKPKARFLTDFSMFATYPDWSWTNDTIVFSTYDLGYRDFDFLADFAPPSDLYTIHPDGTNLNQVTHNKRGATLIRNGTASGPLSSQPTWTPNGGKIIFTQVEGDVWPGWQVAMVFDNGSGLARAAGATVVEGTHARLRPTP